MVPKSAKICLCNDCCCYRCEIPNGHISNYTDKSIAYSVKMSSIGTLHGALPWPIACSLATVALCTCTDGMQVRLTISVLWQIRQ